MYPFCAQTEPLCEFFKKTGGCKYGVLCKFDHPESGKGTDKLANAKCLPALPLYVGPRSGASKQRQYKARGVKDLSLENGKVWGGAETQGAIWMSARQKGRGHAGP